MLRRAFNENEYAQAHRDVAGGGQLYRGGKSAKLLFRLQRDDDHTAR
jgi:hypothetical protein